MAVSTPLSDARLNTLDYSSPAVLEQQRAMNQSAQAGYQQGAQGVQDERNAKLKSLLQGQNESKTLKEQQAALEDLKDKNPNAQVKVGDVSVGVDPAVAIQRKQMQTTSGEANKLNGIYGKDAKDLEGAASQVESGLTGLNQGTPQGDKTAVAALTRLADGKGQRMTQAQLASMTPDSAQGSVEKMMNYWTSTAESGLSPVQRAAMGKLLTSHSQRLQSEYGDTLNEFKQQAPFIAPTMAQSGQLDQYTKSFGQKGSAIFDRVNKLASALPPEPGSSPVSAQNPQPPAHQGIMDRARSGMSSLAQLLGGSGSQPATASPQAPQPGPGAAQPTGPAGFDINSYLGGK